MIKLSTVEVKLLSALANANPLEGSRGHRTV